MEKKKKPVKCECGKIIAYRQGDVLYLYCKRCNKTTEVKLTEPEQ